MKPQQTKGTKYLKHKTLQDVLVFFHGNLGTQFKKEARAQEAENGELSLFEWKFKNRVSAKIIQSTMVILMEPHTQRKNNILERINLKSKKKGRVEFQENISV